MRSLLILGLSFALLLAYMETIVQPTDSNIIQQKSFAKVVRDQAISPTLHNPAKQPSHEKIRAILNLELPSTGGFQESFTQSKFALMNVFEQKSSNEITYNAELVFDADKGENITGGKIHIKIPLS
jgi:hypothetical protein